MDFKQGNQPVNWLTSDGDSAQAALRTVWKDDASFKSNLGKAHAVASRLAERAGMSMDELEDMGLGDHALFIRLAAAAHDDLKPMAPPTDGAPLTRSAGVERPAWLTQAEKSQAYTDPRHDDHESTSKAVRDWYAQTYSGDEVQPAQ